MDKLGDITLFIKIVQNKGLAAAGRELGLSPASVSSRLNRLEENYGVRLINRTTRKIALTDEGKGFYQNSLTMLSELDRAEEELLAGRETLSGGLKITAPIDLGKQHIAPLLANFVSENPGVHAHLDLSDHVVDFIEGGYDLAIRYGVTEDTRMVAKKLADSRRLLCASPTYIEKHGLPTSPQDLAEHQNIIIERDGESLNSWYFLVDEEQVCVTVQPTLSSNDGAQVREWALSGLGIALKSYWDIEADLANGRLVSILSEYQQDYQLYNSDLNTLYLSRKFMPERTRTFIDLLAKHFSKSVMV